MGRKKNYINKTNEEDNKTNDENKMNINEYLSNYSKKRNLDSIFINWFHAKDSSNPRKTKSEWDYLLQLFYKET